MPVKPISEDDALHASYSRQLADESVRKGLIDYAKKRGLTKPEVWRHEGQWVMRHSNASGEIRNTRLGEVFSKARAVIASLATPKTKKLAADPARAEAELAALEKRYKKGGFSSYAAYLDAVRNVKKRYGIKLAAEDDFNGQSRLTAFAKKHFGSNSRVEFDGKQFILRVGGSRFRLGTADMEQAEDKILGLTRKVNTGGKLSLSQADDVAKLKKMFPDMTVTVTPDGQFKIRGDNVNVSDKDLNAVIKKVKAAQALSLAAMNPTAKQVLKQIQQMAKNLQMKGAKVEYDGTNFILIYEGKKHNLGYSWGDARSKIARIKPADDSKQNAEIALLKKEFPSEIITGNEDGSITISVPGTSKYVSGMTAREIMKKVKAAQALSLEDGSDYADDVQALLNAVSKITSDSPAKWQAANLFKSAIKNLSASNADAAWRNVSQAAGVMAKDATFKQFASKAEALASKLKAEMSLSLSTKSTALTRLNALALSEVTYHSGWFWQKNKRIGKTEAEAVEKLS